MRRTQWRSFCFKKNSASHMSPAALATLNISEKRENLFQMPYWWHRRKPMKYLCPGASLWTCFVKTSRHKLYTNSPLWPILVFKLLHVPMDCIHTGMNHGSRSSPVPSRSCCCYSLSRAELEERDCPAGALGTKLHQAQRRAQRGHKLLTVHCS